MKHIKLFEDFRIIEETPKWFYLVLHLRTACESLLNMEFNGVVGISDNPNIINSWFDVRDTLLVMKGEDFLKLNPNVHKIDYKNPNQLLSNNFTLINRLLQNREISYYDVIQKILFNCSYDKTRNEKYHMISGFLKNCLYPIIKIVEEYISSEKNVNNVWDFVNMIWNNLDTLINNYNKSYSWGKNYDKKDFDKNALYYVIQQGILHLSKSWTKEGEWIIKQDKIKNVRTFKVPMNSKLYFKIDVTDQEELERMNTAGKYGSFKGLNDENLKLATDMIENYHLDQLYDVEFIQGHLKTFDIYKEEPIPNTIPYSRLMKTIKGFPKTKKRG